MKKKDKHGKKNILREKAEKKIKTGSVKLKKKTSTADKLKLLHELQVYQVELEIQNAELLKARGNAERTMRKYLHLYDHSPAAFFTIDRSGRILDLNRSGSKMLQTFTEKAVLTRFSSYLPENARQTFDEILDKVFRKKLRITFDTKLGRNGEQASYIQAVASPHDDEGSILLAAMDITKKVEAEQEREKLFETLEKKNAELERFVYTVSHDLKNPLITIQGFTSVLKNAITKGDVQKAEQSLGFISEGAKTMNLLLNDLLQIARTGRVISEPAKIPFLEVIEAAVQIVKGEIDAAGAQILIDDSCMKQGAPGEFVFGDRQRIIEIVQNLLSNAVKFRRQDVQCMIQIGVKDCELDPVFYVSDNGRGIEKRFLEKIFLLFDRLDPNVEGTGVGLAIVKRIVELHKGRIWAESDGPGTGTTFYFTLPLVPEEP